MRPLVRLFLRNKLCEQRTGVWIHTSAMVKGILSGASDGKTAYFASDKSGYGQEDIFWFQLSEDFQAQQVAYVKAKVYDAKSETPLKANIEIVDLATGEVMISSFTYTKTGELFTCLPANTNYAVNISRDDYLFHSENFELNDQSALQALRLDIPLQRLDRGNAVVLKNIFFDTDAYSLKEESEVELNTLLEFMQNNIDLSVEIEGHTDNVGGKAANESLSQRRADAVRQYLVSRSVDGNRVTAKGYGSSRPVDSNTTKEGRANNRRTEFEITAN